MTKSCCRSVSIHWRRGETVVVGDGVGIGVLRSNACTRGADMAKANVKTWIRRCKNIEDMRRIAMRGKGPSTNQVSRLLKFGNDVSVFAI